MTAERVEASDFEALLEMLAQRVADALRMEAGRVAEVPEPHFESPAAAVEALREMLETSWARRGAASAALAEATGRSRRTAQKWLAATPPSRVGVLIAAVQRLLFARAMAEALAEAEQRVAEAEELIEGEGPELAGSELRRYRFADVGSVSVDYQGSVDRNNRSIGVASIDLGAVADELPDIEAAEYAFQAAVLDDYGPGLSQILHILGWDSGIRLIP